jgi:hypothetical protein
VGKYVGGTLKSVQADAITIGTGNGRSAIAGQCYGEPKDVTRGTIIAG